MLIVGWPARVLLIILAIFGFLAALAEVMDFYDAWWMFTVPATLAYAVVLWIFAAPRPAPGEKLTGVVLAGLYTVVVLVGLTFGAIAAVIWLCKLVAGAWPYVALAAVIVAGIVIWALIAGALEDRRARRRGEPGARA